MQRLWLTRSNTEFWAQWNEYFSNLEKVSIPTDGDKEPSEITHTFHYRLSTNDIETLLQPIKNCVDFIDATLRSAEDQQRSSGYDSSVLSGKEITADDSMQQRIVWPDTQLGRILQGIRSANLQRRSSGHDRWLPRIRIHLGSGRSSSLSSRIPVAIAQNHFSFLKRIVHYIIDHKLFSRIIMQSSARLSVPLHLLCIPLNVRNKWIFNLISSPSGYF